MRRRLVRLLAVCSMAAAVMLSGCAAPPVPHSIQERGDCLTCHGQNGVKPYPAWHAERALGDDVCTTCHKMAASLGKP